MLLNKAFHATCSWRSCHRSVHRLLKHPTRYTYHQQAGQPAMGLLPSQHYFIHNNNYFSFHTNPYKLASLRSSTCQSKYISNDRRAANGRRHYHDDHSEPEYLELVTNTADKMRSTVRGYVAEYSRQRCGDSEERGAGEADVIKEEEKNDYARILDQGPPPIKLVGILATTTPHPISINENCHQNYDDDTHGNERYSEQIAACCAGDGIVYEPWRVPPTREALERAIQHANERLDVHGILVFYPVFDKLTNIETKDKTYKCQATGVYYRSMDDYFRDLVACSKDVEGYCRKGLRLQKPGNDNDAKRGDSSEHIVKAEELGPIYPCTALAVYKILESFHLQSSTAGVSSDESKQFENITMTIINRSEVLGLPLATMLSNQGATIYSVNIDSILKFLPNGKVRREHATTTVEQCVRNSSVVVSGVPSNTFKVPTEWISKNATVINVATESNFDEETICNEELGVTYVPHVGRVTVAALEYNLMRLHSVHNAWRREPPPC